MVTYIVLTMQGTQHVFEAELVTLKPGLLVASTTLAPDLPLGKFSCQVYLCWGTNQTRITCNSWHIHVYDDLKLELPIELPPEIFKIINVAEIKDLKDLKLFDNLKEAKQKPPEPKPKESYLKRMYKRIRKGRKK